MRQGSHLKRSRGRPHSQGNGASSSPSIDGRSLAAAPSGHSGGHSGSSSRKHVSMRHQSFVSNGPDGIRVSGNGFTILEKYLNLARDASTGGDRIAAENFYQHAEHYFRMINANNEGQFTPQTPREHFEADIQAAGEAATPGDQAVDEAAINRETRETRESLGDDQIIYGENNGGHGMMPHMARTSESRYAERNMDDGRSSHRRSRHHDEEGGTGGPHLNHPNQTRGRGRFRERRPNQLYQTGAGRGGSGSSMQNGGASHQDYSLPDQNDQGEHRQNQVQNQVQNHVQNHVQ
ncbi:MAG: DUF4167 domain-containing protein, partial [Alphaproteobacteria bacterium]|nr:DUF4167 domain-containing protein [Alphaproteobacteria bacterium]